MTARHPDPDLSLCRALSGVDQISPAHATRILDQASARFGDQSVAGLLAAFASGGLEAVQGSPQAGVARAVVYALYTGILPDDEGSDIVSGHRAKPNIEHEDDHFEALLWRVIHGHPLALSGGYFGHWHYPPEDLDDDDGN